MDVARTIPSTQLRLLLAVLSKARREDASDSVTLGSSDLRRAGRCHWGVLADHQFRLDWRWKFGIWAAAVIVFAAAGVATVSPVEGGYTVISVREAYGYSSVTKAGDLLLVARLEIVEESTEVGVGGIMLSVQDSTGIYSRVKPVDLGNTIRAWYWHEPSTAAPIACRNRNCDAERLALDKTGVEVCAGVAPLLRGASACSDVIWRSSSELSATKSQLTSDIVSMLKNIENADSEISAGDLVSSDKITLTGRDILTKAGANLPTLLDASIYTVAQYDIPGATFDGSGPLPTPSARGLEDARFSNDFGQIGGAFGIPSQIVSFAILLAAGVGMWKIVRLSGGDERVVLIYPGVILMIGATMTGWPPLMAVVGLTSILAVAAVGVMVTKYWPS